MHSSKQAVLAAEHDHEVESYVFYTDFRASGKGFREYVARAEREYGVRYVRSRVARITGDEEDNPVLHYEDAETSRPARMTTAERVNHHLRLPTRSNFFCVVSTSPSPVSVQPSAKVKG